MSEVTISSRCHTFKGEWIPQAGSRLDTKRRLSKVWHWTRGKCEWNSFNTRERRLDRERFLRYPKEMRCQACDDSLNELQRRSVTGQAS